MAWQIKRLGDDVQTPLYDDLFAARRYRVEAERCRAISDIIRNDDARKSMLEVASYYEKLANRHERRPIALAGVGTPSTALTNGADKAPLNRARRISLSRISLNRDPVY
jgi:hypothetical protein